MLLAREVYGWLRYLLNTCPLCMEHRVVVEEIPSTFMPQNDVSDGSRTLTIHKVGQYTPRIEVRFTGLHPQTYWYADGAPEGSLIGVSNQMGFPGDWRSWDCSDFCNWLYTLAVSRILPVTNPDQIGATTEVDALAPKIDIDTTIRLLDSIQRAVNTGKTFTEPKFNTWLKENQGITTHDFGLAVVEYFKTNKKGKSPLHQNRPRPITERDIDNLENKFAPGLNLIDWDVLKRWLDDPLLRTKLTPTMLERIAAAPSEFYPVEGVRGKLEEWLSAYIHGQPMVHHTTASRVKLGRSVLAYFRQGKIPASYIQQLEIADVGERLLPWSFIRRGALRYALAEAEGQDKTLLSSLLVSWLEKSQLLRPLFLIHEEEEEAIKKAILTQIDNYVERTLGSEPWLKAVLESFVGIPAQDLQRALQVEFDLWVMDALRPAIEQWKLPLSPYAFSLEREDQNTYTQAMQAFVAYFREYTDGMRRDGAERLEDKVKRLYEYIIGIWKRTAFEDYEPRIPPVQRVLDASQAGDEEGLLNLLVDDLEGEAGMGFPNEFRTQTLSNPYFKDLYQDLRLQSVVLNGY